MSDVRAAVAGALAALALLLVVVVNIVPKLGNAGVQADVNQRQSFINQNAAVMNRRDLHAEPAARPSCDSAPSPRCPAPAATP